MTQESSDKKGPNLPRRLFWEFRYEKMDWVKAYRTVIGRVVERGNEEEWEEMLRYYGKSKVVETLKNETNYLTDRAIRLAEERLGVKPEELKAYWRKRSRPGHWI
ncbi:hypothetical protein OOZ15_13480 [Galbibacter sp. EGI 63066]|uniref:DUF6922 domain-containing protein n=1 Tax=Galbibacter sp. EGI 63066 TaxID=2993559 RepID=UPI0022491B40|nr:hypothetical protein [Galbibacter sp. EGI 63066]MCX2680959.1 hypothetical protein [Galbibacter sp. EGI 63066]